jgi:two-component system, NarL family, response regulator NreC
LWQGFTGGTQLITILLADNQLSREGMRALLGKYSNDCVIKGEASDGAEALRQLEALKPDVLLVNVELAGTDAVELAGRAGAVSPETKVIVYSTRPDDRHLLPALRAGVKGYVLKTSSFDQLNRALLEVHCGRFYLSDEVLRKLVDYFCQSDHNGDRCKNLTDREKEVLLLARKGSSKMEIARQLNISHRTVEAHRFHAMKKLGLRNQIGLLRYFQDEEGLDNEGSGT